MSTSSSKGTICSLIATGLLLSPLCTGAAQAQETALLAGVVAAEATMVPVSAARVTLVGTDLETVSGENGTFTFPAAPLGSATVRVDATGFPTMVQQVEVTADAVVFVQFLMPDVAAFLDDILVRGRPTPRRLSETRTAADLLAGEVPAVTRNSGIVGLDVAEVRLRGVNSIVEQKEPIIFVNGVRLAGSFGEALALLRQIPSSDVSEIRVERGPASAFLQGSVDGAIYIRTKSGRSND